MAMHSLRRKTLLILLISPLLLAVGHAGASTAPIVAAAASDEATPLAARYELSRGKHRGNWYLWREAGRVETSNELQQRSEIWEWNAQRQLSYHRYFHGEHTYVDYTAGQLLTQHIQPDPARLSSLVDPALLHTLRRGRSVQVLGRTAVHYQGMRGGQHIELLWLPQERLAALLRQSGADGAVTLRLRELHDHSPASWPRVTPQLTASYARIDGSDLGDMEHDPFVAALLRDAGHEEHGTGHAH